MNLDHYFATAIVAAAATMYVWHLCSEAHRANERRRHAAWVRHWNTTPRDGTKSPADRTFEGIVAQLEREGSW